jgi:hypothetical protein
MWVSRCNMGSKISIRSQQRMAMQGISVTAIGEGI